MVQERTNRLPDVDIPWSELRLVLAVQREDSLRGAAKALRLSHPTISRRLSELQEHLGVKLLERHGRRLRLTAAGEDLAATAARIETEVHSLGRRIAGRDHRLEGTVRLAMSPTMLAGLAPHLPRLRAQHPGICIELATGLGFANLTRREADIAIRFTNAPHETLVGRKVSVFESAAYVRSDAERRWGDDKARWPWVDWDEAHRHHSSARWIAELLPDAPIAARCESSLVMMQLVGGGVGAGFVPTMLAERDSNLRRLPEFPNFRRDIWLLTHADLRNVGRIRAVMDWLGAVLSGPEDVWR